MKAPKPGMQKRAFALVRGLLIEWTDPQPLSEFDTTTSKRISHTNPVYRLAAASIMREFGWWMVRYQRLCWQATVTLVFRHPDKDERVALEVEQVATINEISIAIEPEIEQALKEAEEEGYRDCYLHTEFVLRCLGQAKQPL